MPALHLRLTDEQRELLRGWALSEHRSMQQEIIHRLFPAPAPVGVGHAPRPASVPVEHAPRPAPVPAPAQKRDTEPRSPAPVPSGKRTFAPDFKRPGR